MHKIKLRVFDGVALSFFLIMPTLFGTGISELVGQNNSGAWIVLLLSGFLIACLFFIIAQLMRAYDSKNIIDIASDVMGRPLGIAYGIVLSLYFCVAAGINIRESAEILKIYGLEFTPIFIIAGLILLSALLLNFFGYDAIVKSAGLFFVFVTVGIIFVIILGINRYDADNLFPLFGNGISWKNLFTTSIFDGIILLPLFLPYFSESKQMTKTGIISISVCAGSYVLICLASIMIFSPTISSRMMSNFIEIGKSSYYNHFFYRFESILLFFLIFSAAMSAAIGLLAAKESAILSFKLKLDRSVRKEKIISILISALILFVTLIPGDIVELHQWFLPLIRRFSVFFVMGFPLLILIIGRVKRFLSHEKI